GRRIYPMFRRPQVDVFQRSAGSHVGTIGIVRIAIARLIKAKCWREGAAALQIHDRVQLPAAHELAPHTFQAVQEWLVLPKRQFINAVQAEPVPDIKSRQAVIPPSVVCVHDHANLSAGLSSGNCGLVIEASSKCVVASQTESIAKPAIHVHENTVVIVDAGCEENSCTAQQRITASSGWEILGSSRKTRRASRRRTNGRKRLVRIGAQNLVVTARSDVADAKAYVAR